MIIDPKSIMIEQFTGMFENHLGLISIIFAVAIVAFIFRHDLAYDFDLTRREKNRFTEKTILIPLAITVATIGYLFVKEQYFLLSIIFSVMLTYFLYLVGFFDILVDKWK